MINGFYKTKIPSNYFIKLTVPGIRTEKDVNFEKNP